MTSAQFAHVAELPNPARVLLDRPHFPHFQVRKTYLTACARFLAETGDGRVKKMLTSPSEGIGGLEHI